MVVLEQHFLSLPKSDCWLPLCTYFQISHKDQTGQYYKYSPQYNAIFSSGVYHLTNAKLGGEETPGKTCIY